MYEQITLQEKTHTKKKKKENKIIKSMCLIEHVILFFPYMPKFYVIQFNILHYISSNPKE